MTCRGLRPAHPGLAAPGCTLEASVSPDHLFVMVHGINGHSSTMDALSASVVAQHGETVLCHAITSNQGFLYHPTHDGIVKGSERAEKEVRRVIAAHASLRFISFLGFSLGGLYARQLIGEF